MEKYGYQNVYRVTDCKNPFDSYQQQDVLLLDEFDSQLRIRDMLNYFDGYPLELGCRYINKVACYTKVFIISNTSLQEQYKDEQISNNEVWKAFFRRINTIIEMESTEKCYIYKKESDKVTTNPSEV